MFCRFIFLVALLGVCSVSSFTQKTDIPKSTTVPQESRETENQKRNQAIFLLRDNLSRYKSIDDLRQRAYVVTEASTILWDYDRTLAEESLIGFINQCLADYKELLAKEKRTAEDDKTLDGLAYVLKLSLKVISQKNPKSALPLRNRYFKAREDGLKSKNLDEELELAADGLDLDDERAIALMKAVIQQRIPNSFPTLAFALRSQNPRAAEILVNTAVQNLSVNSNYKASDAIYLSAVIFSERELLLPLVPDETTPNNFGVFYYPGTPLKITGNESISLFVIAVLRFFEARLANQASGFFDSPQNLIQSYFLLEKLKSYGQAYGVIDTSVVERVSIPIVASMQRVGISEQTLSEVRGYAFRVATSNNPLDLDDGTRGFEKADNAKTPEDKLRYLVDAIVWSIQIGKFAKAEAKIFDVQNSEIRDVLYSFLNMRSGLAAIELGDWAEFEKKTEKIVDKRTKAFMYLKAISGFKSSKDPDSLLIEYVVKAEKNINELSDKTQRASCRVYLTSLLFSLGNVDNFRDLPAAISSVNDASDYAENRFELSITIPTRSGRYAEYIGANSFRDLFTKLAKVDWTNSQVQALQIKRAGLRAIAQLATARAILQQKTPKK